MGCHCLGRFKILNFNLNCFKFNLKLINTNLNIREFPGSSVSKESACNAGDLGSITGLGRSPGEGKGYPLQYSGLKNSMDCIVHGVPRSQTRLSDFHFTSTGKMFYRTVHTDVIPRCFLLLLEHVSPLEKAMAPHSSTLAWKIPRTEEPDGLQSMGSRRVGHD